MLKANAETRLQDECHFRIGMHAGDCYTFWDPGRRDWNYTGSGINVGQRILAAIGKDLDNAIFVSDAVYHHLVSPGKEPSPSGVSRSTIAASFLRRCSNRGRRKDKHDQWHRLYELSFPPDYDSYLDYNLLNAVEIERFTPWL